jgi:hypothetical protein
MLAFAAAILHAQSPGALALTNCSTSTMAIDAAEQQVANEINARRADHGLPALKLSPNLSRAAAWKSEDSSNGSVTFNHIDSLNRMPSQRAEHCGYRGGAAEILAVGFRSASSVVDGWVGSPGHRSVMLGENYTVMGVGVTGTSYAVKFGFVDDSSAPWDSGPPPFEPLAATPTPTPTAVPTPAPQVVGIVRGVSPGVNLVAYEGFPVTPAEAFRSLETSLQWVYAWDPPRQTWLRYAPGAPDYVNTLRFVVPGTAYYVSVTSATTWSY